MKAPGALSLDVCLLMKTVQLVDRSRVARVAIDLVYEPDDNLG